MSGLSGILRKPIPRYDDPASSISLEGIFRLRDGVIADWEHSVARQDAAEM